jgi:hypothetical protein
MQLWASWLPDLLPQLPGCPIPIVEHELRRAAQMFFDKTRAWNVTLAALPVIAAQDTVTVAPTSVEQELVRIGQAWYDDAPLSGLTGDEMSEQFGDNWQDHTGVPKAFVEETPGVLRLYPVPVDAATVGLVARIAVKPSEASTGIPDELAVKHRTALTDGALGKLMLYVDKPWSNADFGVKHSADFMTAINSATVQAAFGRGRIASRPSWC